MITLFQFVIEDSICLKNRNLSLNHLLLASTNILKHPPINTVTKLLVTVVEVIVITIEVSLEALVINPVLTHAQTLVQNFIISTLLTTILHPAIVTDLALTNIIKVSFKIIICLSLKL